MGILRMEITTFTSRIIWVIIGLSTDASGANVVQSNQYYPFGMEMYIERCESTVRPALQIQWKGTG